jgi:hypothetical protein
MEQNFFISISDGPTVNYNWHFKILMNIALIYFLSILLIISSKSITFKKSLFTSIGAKHQNMINNSMHFDCKK